MGYLIPNHDALLDDPRLRQEDRDDEVDGEDDEFDPCVFCESTRHDPSDCPKADESIDEDLFE